MRVQAVLERTGLWQDRRTYYSDCSTGTKKRLNFARSLLLDAFVEVCRARMR
jgi:ABC-type multidrug transport system ATPase subunit